MHPERVRRRALALYRAGFSSRGAVKQVNVELGAAVAPQTVAAWARQAGINRPVGDRRRVELPNEAVQLYRSGRTLREVGGRLQVSPTTVAKRLRELGIPIRPRGLRYPRLMDKSWLEDQYVRQGRSAKAIARALGCGVLIVHYHLRRHGIPRKRRQHKTR